MSAALDLPESERAPFLAREPDAEIRDAVGKLLAAHDAAGGFIDKPLLIEQGVAEDDTQDSFTGRQIENYLILERIGAGGMGAVYLAERVNSDFKQKVALKLIKRGMDSEAILKRFAVERKILSTLKHSNIAQLIDGGISSEGLPFFVMEFVDGKSLNEFCRENDLSLEERLKIFGQICAAVEYAHQNLIVHRDLKPSNILVSDDGVPKLLDFGIAKLLSDEDAQMTATQTKMFTPEYASPEQILGKTVTTATDVYSLGVILYELLSGHRPFETKGKSYEEIIKSVCEINPVRPSAWISDFGFRISDLNTKAKFKSDETQAQNGETDPESRIPNPKLLKGDLDNIILKALRKEPSERYGSVRHLTEDISRFLHGLPVLARPQTLKYRFGKFVKRHKAGVFAAALVLLSLFGGISVATWQAIVARRERALAEQRFRDVRQLANAVLFEYHDGIEKLSGSTEIREKMVKDALDYLDRLSSESSEDTELQLELARAYTKVGDIQGNTSNPNRSQFDLATESYLKALKLNENVFQKNKFDLQVLNQLAQNYVKLARVARIKGNLEESVGYFKKSVEIYRKILENQPTDAAARQSLAWSQINIATQQEEPEQIDESLTICREAVGIIEKLAADDPTNEKYQSNLPAAYEALADVMMAKPEKRVEALEFYRKALGSFEENLRQNPDNLDVRQRIALIHSYLADALYLTNKSAEADAEYKKSLALYDEVVKLDAKNEFAAFERAAVKVFFAKFLVEQEKGLEALEILQEPLKVLPIRFEQNPEEFVSDFLTALANQSFGKAKILHYKAAKNPNELKIAENSLKTSVAIYAKYLDKVVVPRMSAKDLAAEATKDLNYCLTNRIN